MQREAYGYIRSMCFPCLHQRGYILAAWLLPLLAGAQAYNYPDGSTVEDFSVTDVNGIVHDLYDLNAQGKYVFLDFFTLWCAPCQETAPYWAELYQTYGCNSGQVVCLSLDFELNTVGEIQTYADTYYGAWAHPPVVSGALPLSDVFGVGNAPNYCLIGPDHVMIRNFIWPVASMADFVAVLPSDSGILPQACAAGVPDDAGFDLVVQPNPTTGWIRTNDPQVVNVRVSDPSGRPLGLVPVQRGEGLLPGGAMGLYVLEFLDARGHARGRARVIRM